MERGDIVEKPDMAKKRKLLPLFVIIIIFVIVLVFYTLGGIFHEWLGIHSKGLRFFLDNERYSVEYIERDDIEDCVLRFDFNDPEAATGQVVYEENGAEIVVTEVEVQSEFQIKFWFEATGTYDFKKGEGRFVSPFYTVLENDTWKPYMPSMMFQYSKTALNAGPNEEYGSGFTSATPEYEKLTNEFSIGVWDNGYEDASKIGKGRPAEVTFCKLYETAWHRK